MSSRPRTMIVASFNINGQVVTEDIVRKWIGEGSEWREEEYVAIALQECAELPKVCTPDPEVVGGEYIRRRKGDVPDRVLDVLLKVLGSPYRCIADVCMGESVRKASLNKWYGGIRLLLFTRIERKL